MYRSGLDNLVKGFYIPSLNESVLYRRRTGYFNSRALAMAARGLSGLLKNDGKMQLLCSVELETQDATVLENPEEYLKRRSIKVTDMLDKPYDELEKTRLALLAELLGRGKLEIKIAVLRKGIYHEKSGIFEDAEKNIVVFNGSGNETPGGWLHNMESFHAFQSWEDTKHIKPEIELFNMLWEDRYPNSKIRVLPLPVAVSQKLLKYRDYFREDLDDPVDPGDLEGEFKVDTTWKWTPDLAFIFEAPRLWNHEDFAYSKVAVNPFNHQDYIASTILKDWPPRHILCDEVGLGKTIEAGLVIKGFTASGRINTRLLILAPKNALIQWQQEMLSKFHIPVWRLDGDYIYGPTLDPRDKPERRPVDEENPFRSHRFLLVASQLARRENRQEQILSLDYDLVVLDEAHHARARRIGGRREPNKLLRFLEELRYHTQGMLLLSATPIQLDRRELWDLLNILELPGRWQDENKFDDFFSALDEEHIDWQFLLSMTGSAIDAWGLDEEGRKMLGYQFPDIIIPRLIHILKEKNTEAAFQLSPKERKVLKLLIYRNSPIRHMVFRNTRELLRKYKQEGKFDGKIAQRRTEKVQIELAGSKDDPKTELGLYHKIDVYVKEFYGKYKLVRLGLGFLMETYRKRLTSSFYAINQSLLRRYEKLGLALRENNALVLFEDLDDDDLLDAGLSLGQEEDYVLDMKEESSTRRNQPQEWKELRKVIQEEYDFLHGFIRDLQDPQDTKLFEFRKLLRELRNSGTRQVIVFSQYKDTIEYLLSNFRQTLGDIIGSYTGDGGQYWDGSEWVKCSKQILQKKFADPEDRLSILFCTDAASESINLQTCDTVINYDIPWNPMRIEQRIGRVDRIGQVSEVVKVFTLTYKDTVEDKAFSRCLDRIEKFTTTLGYLQPILQATERVIRKAALEGDEGSIDELFDQELNVAKAEEDARIWELINSYEPQLPDSSKVVPITQLQLEATLSPILRERGWRQDGPIWSKDDKRITFDLSLMDRNADMATVITPTSDLFGLFGNLPKLPYTLMEGEKEITVIRVRGFTGFLVRIGSEYRLVTHYSDLKDVPSGRAFHTIEEATRELESRIIRGKRQYLLTQKTMLENRLKGWEVRVQMYLERIFEWYLKKTKSDAKKLTSYSGDSLEKGWHTYLNDPDREKLKELANRVKFTIEPHMKEKTKGRVSKQSPRNSITEQHFRKQFLEIQNELKEIETRLGDVGG